jgi:hypothetical protein
MRIRMKMWQPPVDLADGSHELRRHPFIDLDPLESSLQPVESRWGRHLEIAQIFSNSFSKNPISGRSSHRSIPPKYPH